MNSPTAPSEAGGAIPYALVSSFFQASYRITGNCLLGLPLAFHLMRMSSAITYAKSP